MIGDNLSYRTDIIDGKMTIRFPPEIDVKYISAENKSVKVIVIINSHRLSTRVYKS